ncbi:MerR family DNA-binding transcriptional regulator [Gracilibacillus alcaliphilus]|uniref:MerR family DNA-binding transcriptional regulator n=1 Tax=Gracilibacillus alcaliphilus TaxID=1401441 RepID=UPI001957F212|nr:MerR family DNA-binding transcriptional regulator [Gracilibacillus alcaliphilus]MBM7675316.1 DNA-binding transcriptional MerR regulator [Gracilibacillus alcaliphilus]
MKNTTFSVSEFAKYTDVSVRTLHYYDETNILKPKRDASTGHRVYEKDDTTFDSRFIETLRLQEAKLLTDKDKIETALETIQFTVQILENEKEIDHALLVSLMANMQNE